MLRYLVVLAAASMPVIAWFNQRGVFGPDNGTISDRYPTLLVAAGYAFSIWGVIFLLDLLLSISQARAQAVARHAVTDRTRTAMLIGFGLTASWMIIFSQQIFWLALTVIWAALAAVLTALLDVDRRTAGEETQVQPLPGGPLARMALGLHAGWLSLAAFLNTAQVIVAYGILPADRMLPWSIVLWIGAGALLSTVVARLRRPAFYVAAATWGLAAAAVEQMNSSHPGARISAAIAVTLAVMLVVQLVLKRRPREPRRLSRPARSDLAR